MRWRGRASRATIAAILGIVLASLALQTYLSSVCFPGWDEIWHLCTSTVQPFRKIWTR